MLVQFKNYHHISTATPKKFHINIAAINLNSDNGFNQTSGNTSSLEATTLKPKFSSLMTTTRRFTFEQLFSGKQFLVDYYDYIWLPDGSFVQMNDDFTVSSIKWQLIARSREMFVSDKETNEKDSTWILCCGTFF